MKKLFSFFAKIFLAPIVGIFVKEVNGKENIPRSSSFIVASNHLDGWDHYFISFALKERLDDIHFIGALDSFKTFFLFGLLYWVSDTIVIRRTKTKREKLTPKVLKYLKKGSIIIIYPEGDTNPDKVLLKGKTGVADFVLGSGCPVLPVGVQKIENSKKRVVNIGKPLYFSKNINEIKGTDEYKQYSREITDSIMREISKLSGKPYPY